MWIAACTCGSGMVADTESEVADMAETHLIMAPTPSNPSDPWKHSVHFGESVKSCRLRPHWDGGEEPARPAQRVSNGSAPTVKPGGTLSPAEITRMLKSQELKYQAEDEDIDGPRPEPRNNPYTVDPEPGVDVGFRQSGAYAEEPEDYSGWGGPGGPSGGEDAVSIDPVDGPTDLSQLPEGIMIDGRSGTAPPLQRELYEDGPDYTLDTDMKKPVWPENRGQ